MYAGMSRADLNYAQNFSNEWDLYWLQMALKISVLLLSSPIPLYEHDQTCQWGMGTSSLWIILGAWALLPGWQWEVYNLVEVHLEQDPKPACVLASLKSWDYSSSMTWQSKAIKGLAPWVHMVNLMLGVSHSHLYRMVQYVSSEERHFRLTEVCLHWDFMQVEKW